MKEWIKYLLLFIIGWIFYNMINIERLSIGGNLRHKFRKSHNQGYLDNRMLGSSDGCNHGKSPMLQINNSKTKTKTPTPYTQYTVNFKRIPPNYQNCKTDPDPDNGYIINTANTQSVYFIVPDKDPEPNDGYPFIMYFEFIDDKGCLEVYGKNTGYGGLIRQTDLEDAKEGKHFNVLQNIHKVYENCIDNGIGLVIVPDYIYDVRNFMDCPVGYKSPGNEGCDNNMCWNEGHNPDMYLINQILFNIKYHNNKDAKPMNNPCNWPEQNWAVDNSPFPEDYQQMEIMPNMDKINFDLDKIGIMGYSVGAHFVSRLINEWNRLPIWHIIDEKPSLNLAVLIAGGSYHCYRTSANNKFIDSEGNIITDDTAGCWPNEYKNGSPNQKKLAQIKQNGRSLYSTKNCANTYKGTCYSDYNNPDDWPATDFIPSEINCDSGKAVTSNRGCCPFAKGDADDSKDNPHPPTILLDTQCDAWSDPNATIYYKAAYPNNKNIILLPSSLSGDLVHGIVDNQVEHLNDLIVYYFKDPNDRKDSDLDTILDDIKFPGPLPTLPVKWKCNLNAGGPCTKNPLGFWDDQAYCTKMCHFQDQ